MHTDGKLYCVDVAGAAMHASPTLGSAVVNHLRTTNSYFQCWGTGDRHAGGNTTWYYTIGDDNGNWGWVPAVDLQTEQLFRRQSERRRLPALLTDARRAGAQARPYSTSRLSAMRRRLLRSIPDARAACVRLP